MAIEKADTRGGGRFVDHDEALLPLFAPRRYPASRRWRALFGEPVRIERGGWRAADNDERD